MLKAYLKLDLNRLLVPENLKGSQYITPSFIKKYIEENILGISSDLKRFDWNGFKIYLIKTGDASFLDSSSLYL